MNKGISLLLLFATTGFAASESTTVDESEVVDNKQSAILKSVDVPSSYKTSKRLFLRNGIKVAALVTATSSMRNEPPKVRKLIQFLIDDDNWVEIDLGDPRLFTSRFVSEATISATDDSITVTAPKQSYCEVFFKSTGTFLDGPTREKMVPEFLKLVTAPR